MLSMFSILNRSITRRHFFTSSLRRVEIPEEYKYLFESHVPEGSHKLWKKLLFLVALPSIAFVGINCLVEHKHLEQRPDFVKYEYLRIRTKRFPWGEGEKTLFHNPKLNALPAGYENENNEIN